jgi:UDP-N-acetyl-D-galactosamine dehydrogenase
VDPYYLIYKSKQKGYDPQVILSGRRVNHQMPSFIAKKLVQFLIQAGKNPRDCSVLVLGITFKENVADIRNSKVADLVKELLDYSLKVQIADPLAIPEEVEKEYGLQLNNKISNKYDVIVAAVAHEAFKDYDLDYFETISNPEPILMDIKGLYPLSNFSTIKHWRL